MKWENYMGAVIIIAFCFVVLFCGGSAYLFSQDASQDPLSLQQTNLSSQVRSALLESRRSMGNLEQSYQAMINLLNGKLETQSEELTTLSTRLTDTMNSFRASSAALENSNLKLEREKRKNKTLVKLLWAGTVLFLINAAGKVVMFALWGKGVKAPRWLDILV